MNWIKCRNLIRSACIGHGGLDLRFFHRQLSSRQGVKSRFFNGFEYGLAMNTSCFELCVETLEAARAAEAGGADRIELCSKLPLGGVSPSLDLLTVAISELHIPVHVLIRPRDGDFCFSASEFEMMKLQITKARKAGAAGVAVGVLLADSRVDVERSRELAELAHPMKSTFHRAFDETPNLDEALEDVISTGADCLLTSGGAKNVLAGAESIARVRERSGQRMDVMAGGGLRLHTLTEVVRKTGVSFLHGSLTRRGFSTQDAGPESPYSVLEADVREAVRLFRLEFTSNGTSVPHDFRRE